MRAFWLGLVACGGGKDGGDGADTDAPAPVVDTATTGADATGDTAAEDTDPRGPPASDPLRYAGCVGDGVVDELDDGTIDHTFHVEYDAYGFQALEEDDLGADGTIDFVEIDVRDVFGNTLDGTTDQDGDGVVDYVVHGEYDADGNPIRVEIDDDGDGTVEYTFVYTATDGLLRSGELVEYGEVAYRYAWEYDALDREVRYASFSEFTGAQSSEVLTRWYEDTEVRVGVSYTFYEGDGTTWRTAEWEASLDATLRVVSDHLEDFVYDEPYMTVDRAWSYEGDAAEAATMDEVQTDEGYPDLSGTFTWTYDDARRVIEELYTGATADGSDLTERTTWTWSCPAQ